MTPDGQSNEEVKMKDEPDIITNEINSHNNFSHEDQLSLKHSNTTEIKSIKQHIPNQGSGNFT